MLRPGSLIPRRRQTLDVPPWRTDWLTARLLRQGVGQALQRAFAALGSGPRGQGLRMLDLGCGERPWASWFSEAHCIGVDLDPRGASPDVVARADALPFAGNTFDLIFSSQVLEHVPQDQPVLVECARTLRGGGQLVLSVPFYWPLHEEPHDYRRFTRHGLLQALQEAGFSHIDIRPDSGSLSMVVTAGLELLPRRHGAWLLLAPLVLLVNLCTLAAQALSRDRRSTLNWIATAQRR